MNRIISYAIILTLFFFNSCQKDIDVFVPNAGGSGLDTNWVTTPSSSSLISELKQSLSKVPVTDSIDGTTGGIVTTREGLTLNIMPQSFVLPNGTPSTGKVYAETILINKKGDIVSMDKPTTSNNRILISGGELYVKFRKDGDELHLAPNKRLYFKYNDPTPTPMSIFYGDESNSNSFNWMPAHDTSGVAPFMQGTFVGYEGYVSNLKWINIDHFADTAGQRINLFTSLPINYTNANTAVYIVFRDQKSVLALYGDPIEKKFMSRNIPIGKSVTVVSISKKGNNSYYLAHENIITGQSGTTNGQTVPLNPQPTSLPDIKSYLATL